MGGSISTGRGGMGGVAGGGATGGVAGSGGGGAGGSTATGALAWVDIFGQCPLCTTTPLDSAADVAVVPGGNGDLFVAGTFSDTANFVGDQVQVLSAGNTDAFIARYHGDGSLVWVRREGGTTRDTGTRVTALADGGAIMGGTTSGMPTFGAGEANEVTFTSGASTGLADFCFYLARFASDGHLTWAHQACSSENFSTSVSGLSAAPDGTFYVTGRFLSTLVLGANGPSPITLTQPAQSGLVEATFIARFDSNGEPLWAHALTNMAPTDVVAMPSGGAVFTLEPDLDPIDNPPGTFGAGQPNAVTVPTDAQSAIARYDASGAFQWVTFASAPPAATRITTAAVAAATSPGGGFAVAGTVQGANDTSTATFASGTPQAVTIAVVPTGNESGPFDAFVARYDETGHLVWLRSEGGPAQESALDVATTPDGGAVVVGLFGVLSSPGHGISPPTTAVFGSGEAGQTTLMQIGQVDSFVLRVDGSGQLLWAKREGGAPVEPASDIGHVTATAVSTFPDGGSVNVGNAAGEVVFGEHEPSQRAFDLGGPALYSARLAP